MATAGTIHAQPQMAQSVVESDSRPRKLNGVKYSNNDAQDGNQHPDQHRGQQRNKHPAGEDFPADAAQDLANVLENFILRSDDINYYEDLERRRSGAGASTSGASVANHQPDQRRRTREGQGQAEAAREAPLQSESAFFPVNARVERLPHAKVPSAPTSSQHHVEPQEPRENIFESSPSYEQGTDFSETTVNDGPISQAAAAAADGAGGSLAARQNSAGALAVGDDLIADLFDQRALLLAATLESTACRAQSLVQRLLAAEAEACSTAERLAGVELSNLHLREELADAAARERALEADVARLKALLDAHKLQASYTHGRLQDALVEERARVGALRALRDEAVASRDEALSQLAGALADMDALQATLADSAVYVRYLRRRVLELELANSRVASEAAAAAAQAAAAQAQAASGGAGGGGGGGGGAGGGGGGAFSLSSVRAAIHRAVSEAAESGDEAERKRKIRALQLRWHPDKNPVLTEFATEVTKMINEAVDAMEQGKPLPA